jgi:hypothetical protein
VAAFEIKLYPKKKFNNSTHELGVYVVVFEVRALYLKLSKFYIKLPLQKDLSFSSFELLATQGFRNGISDVTKQGKHNCA